MSDGGKTIVYVPRKVEFKVGGRPFDVSYITISLSKNDVPTAQIGIAPEYHTKKTNVHILDVKTLKKVYSELLDMARQLVESELTVDIEAVNDHTFDQKLCLTGWPLVSVGMNHISATDLFELECCIAHPAYKTRLYEGFFFDSAIPLNNDAMTGAPNPLDAADIAFKVIKETNEAVTHDYQVNPITNSHDEKEQNQIDELIEKGMAKALEAKNETLVWDIAFSTADKNIPCETYLHGEMLEGMKRALCEAWIQGGCNATVWGRLIGTVCPWFMCEVVANYASESPGGCEKTKLKVTPINPWRKRTVHLNDLRCHAFDMPGYDPDPVYGATMDQVSGTAPQDAGVSFPTVMNQKLEIQPLRMSYIPKPAELSVGKLLHLQEPDWAKLIFSHAAPRDGQPGMGTFANLDMDFELDFKIPPQPASGGDNTQLKENNTALTAWVNKAFVKAYRNQVSSTCHCALTIYTEYGELVYPGKRMQYLTGEDHEVLFSGEIERVEHCIDCARSTGSTMIQVSYCDTDGKAAKILGGGGGGGKMGPGQQTLLFPVYITHGWTD